MYIDINIYIHTFTNTLHHVSAFSLDLFSVQILWDLYDTPMVLYILRVFSTAPNCLPGGETSPETSNLRIGSSVNGMLWTWLRTWILDVGDAELVRIFGAGGRFRSRWSFFFFAELFKKAEFNSGKKWKRNKGWHTTCCCFFFPGEKQMLDLALVLGHDVSWKSKGPTHRMPPLPGNKALVRD